MFNEQKLKNEVARLSAALEDTRFECQRLEIVNNNLDFLVKDKERELSRNIAYLQALEEENKQLRTKISELEEKIYYGI